MKVDKSPKKPSYLLSVDLNGRCVDIKYLRLSVNLSTNKSLKWIMEPFYRKLKREK